MSGSAARRIRALFLVPSLRRAGAETQTVDLLNALDPERFEAHLAFFDPGDELLDRIDIRRVRVHRLQRRRKLDLDFVSRLREVIEQSQVDIVHCTLQISLFFACLALMRSRARPRLITAIHTTLNRSVREEIFDRLLYRWMLKGCDRIVFVCRAQAEHWARKYPELRSLSAVVYNGVDADRYDPALARDSALALRHQLHIAPDARVVSCIANMRPEKGHEFLVEAFAKLPNRPWLLLAGDGPLRARIQDLAARRAIQDRVAFLGIVPDVRPVIAAADVTVLPSVAESFSMSMLESMAMGVPVVASDVGGLGEAIVDGETGALVPPRDVARLRQALQHILDRDDERRAMGSRARERVRAQFSLQGMASATGELLAQVLDEPDSAPAEPERVR